LTVLRAPQLTFERIKLDSPLEITLTATGSTGVIIYGLHLFCAFPSGFCKIGGWLPRLVAGWQKARREAARTRQEHRVEVIRGQLTDLLIKQNISTLLRLAENPELEDLRSMREDLRRSSTYPLLKRSGPSMAARVAGPGQRD
jgi:hypothetical protein